MILLRNVIKTGFSLVEVTLAMGIVSFCLLAILGLLPAGLLSAKTSREHVAAAACVEQIAAAIQFARPLESGIYKGTGVLSDVTWSRNGAQVSTGPLRNLSLGGVPADNTIDQRLVAHVTISPPGGIGSGLPTGSALISVAWPNQAEWNEQSKKWSNAQGAVSSHIVFLPNQ